MLCISIFFPPKMSSGGPMDLMSRRVVAANNSIIGERIIKEIEAFSPVRDDAPVDPSIK